jgi:hypothetical protein
MAQNSFVRKTCKPTLHNDRCGYFSMGIMMKLKQVNFRSRILSQIFAAPVSTHALALPPGCGQTKSRYEISS